jgi:uncharacterized membrane protein YjgN (DUF898 family)
MEAGKDTYQNNATTSHQFQFTGNGAEYFKIWIVNLLLSIITLGIYSAWAKVRTKRYFYGNTHLAESSFDYLANPVTILKGRLIAVGLLAIYLLVGSFAPGSELILALIFLPFLPLLIVKALIFNAQNSSYRNVRFNFTASVGDAFKEYLLFPMLIIFTLGLIFPYINFRQHRFTVTNHLFGQSRFNFSATPGQYFKVFGWAILFMFLFGIFISILMGAVIANNQGADPESIEKTVMYILPFSYIFYGVIGVYIQVKLLNILFSNTALESDNFKMLSTYKVDKMLWIHISNLIGIILTLGLFYPWAKVRMAKYRVENLSLKATKELDEFASVQSDNISATGDEIGEVFAIDVGI